ncbi:phage major tail tube protein (plasmid) [Escherichia coli]|nr:phage major tail tube protein [Escherichia coli]
MTKYPLVTFLTIMFKKNPLGTFKQHENAEFSSSFTCTYIRRYWMVKSCWQLDYLANIFRSAVLSQLTDYRINNRGLTVSVELTDKGGRCAALACQWYVVTLLDIPGVETLFNTRKTNDPIDCTRSKAANWRF